MLRADSAADLGRRHQLDSVMDARRILLWVSTHWYHIFQQLHRFMIAISRGGVARPLIPLSGIKGVGASIARWISGLLVVSRLPGPLGFLHRLWVKVHGGCICGAGLFASGHDPF